MTKNISTVELDSDLKSAIDKANFMLEAGDYQACVTHCLNNLVKYGEQSLFLKILGTIAFNQGETTHAEDFYLRLTKLCPDDAISWAGLGMVYGASDQTKNAISALEKSVALKPANPVPYLNLGIALMKAQRIEEARDVLVSAAEVFPDFTQIQIWLGHAYSALDQISQAMSAYEKVVSLNPDDISVMLPLALLERDIGNIDASTRCLEKILNIHPTHPVASFTRSQNLLIAGRLEEGFKAYECRWEREGMVRPKLAGKLWLGTSLEGKSILVYSEQGFGDAIQFVRYLSLLKKAGAKVHLMVHPRLQKLLATVGGIDKIISKVEEDSADYNVAMMSLPFHLKTNLDSIPDKTPYLKSDESLIGAWREKLDRVAGPAKLKVGLVWQGDPNSQSDKGRSIPFDCLRALFELTDIHFFLIQKHDGVDQINDRPLPVNVTNLGVELDLGKDAFSDTAAVMNCLDLTISSDTSAAHLAGSLGALVWVMLKYVPEWRWMLERDDSPWYPTARLFRQKNNGDWPQVVQNIKANLKELARR